jgi:hypothetical protein
MVVRKYIVYIVYVDMNSAFVCGVVLDDREGEKEKSGERADSASKDKTGNVTRSIQCYLIMP